jgi:hypothetical protein
VVVKYQNEKYSVYSLFRSIYLPAVNATFQNISCRNRHHIGAALWRGSSEREDCQNTTVRSVQLGAVYMYVLRTVAGQLGGGGGGEGIHNHNSHLGEGSGRAESS